VVFRHSSIVAAPCARVFRWHERPEALLDLMPLRRWVRIEQQVGGLRDGGRLMQLGGPLSTLHVIKQD